MVKKVLAGDGGGDDGSGGGGGGGEAASLKHYAISGNLKEIVTQAMCGRAGLEALSGKKDME